MTAFIGRREFITLLGGAAALAARGAGAGVGPRLSARICDSGRSKFAGHHRLF